MKCYYSEREYELLFPPVHKPFPLMDQIESEAFFSWFTSVLDKRVEYLTAHFPHFGYAPLSPRSLIPLWTWFLKQAKTEVIPDEVIQQNKVELMDRSPELAETIFRSGDTHLTLETELLLWDVGIYLGQTLIRNEPSLKWTHYGPDVREDMFVNKPVIAGFRSTQSALPFDIFFDPVHMVHIQAVKIMRNKADRYDLYRLYKKYVSEYIYPRIT